jgi:hypothetical protein
MGKDRLATLRAGVPRSQLLPLNPAPELIDDLKTNRRRKVLKVVDSDAAEDTWGSRGVYFGDQAAVRWTEVVDAATAGHIPGWPNLVGTRFVISDLVDSGKFDVEFLHPMTAQLCVMPGARLRLTPIFARGESGCDLLGGHATFVNTSRKVHATRSAHRSPSKNTQRQSFRACLSFARCHTLDPAPCTAMSSVCPFSLASRAFR